MGHKGRTSHRRRNAQPQPAEYGLLIRGQRHLHRVLTVYIEHYNSARLHRGIQLTTPMLATSTPDVSRPVERVDLLGGLVHQYQRAA